MLLNLIPSTDHNPTGLLAVTVAIVGLMMVLFVALNGWMPYGTWRVALEITDDLITTHKQERQDDV